MECMRVLKSGIQAAKEWHLLIWRITGGGVSLEQLEIVMQTWVEGVGKNGQNLITVEIREECRRLVILVTLLENMLTFSIIERQRS